MTKHKKNKSQRYLEQGINHHQSGNLRDASKSYRKALKHAPDFADALNLLGVVSMQSYNSEKAAKLFNDALALDSQNLAYMNNLGQAFQAMGDANKAIERYLQALQIQPENSDFLNNLGISLKFLNRYDEARVAFKKALSSNNEDPGIHHNFGILLQEIDEDAHAINSYQTALSLDANLAETHGSLASAYEKVGQPELAIETYMNAIKLKPYNTAAHVGFKKIRWASRDLNGLHDSYKYVCSKYPVSPDAHYNLAQSYSDSGEIENGFEAAHEALSLDEWHMNTLRLMPMLHRAQKNYDLAIEAHKRVLELDGANFLTHEAYGNTLIVAKLYEEACSELLTAYKLNPRRSSVLGGLTIAMNEAQNPSVINYVDYETYVTSRFVDVPEGFEDLKSFNDALHDEIAARHDDRPPPSDQTMRGGTQIPGHLFNGATGLTLTLKQKLTLALSEYIETLKDDPNHPFLRYQNPEFRFTGAWSTIIYGEGYDDSHIHNDGWLSGVYYIKVPDLPEKVWENGEGCLQFGQPPSKFALTNNRPHKLIRPSVGRAVFFPSYYWHGVQPFKREGLRHAIAFDII